MSRGMLFSTVAVGVLLAVPAAAQTSTQDTGSAQSESQSESQGEGIGEIVVTAQRRSESVQDVPIAISAFSGDQLREQGISSTLDVAQYVPNMVSSNNTGLGSANAFYIRGLGNTETIPTFDPPVGTYVDDIYLSRQNANNLSLFDVGRIEVLRGPQGTLFGRNTTGGAVNVIMAQPEFNRFAGYGEIGYGSYDKKVVRGSVDLPLADTLAVKVSGYWQDDDGYTINNVTGDRLNDDDGWGLRLGIRGELSPSVRWSGSFAYIVADGENILNFDCDPANPGNCAGRFSSTGLRSEHSDAASPFGALGITGRKADWLQGNHTQTDLVTSNLEIDVASNATLALITGYVYQGQQYAIDFYDGRAAPTLSAPVQPVRGYTPGGFTILNDGKSDQFSQEVKLNGSLAGGLVDYVAGFYYMKEDVRTDFADVFSAAPTVALVLGDRVLDNSTEAYAGYAQADLNVTSKLKLTAGIRYTDETKTIGFTDNRATCRTAVPAASCLTTANLVAANGEPIPTRQHVKIWTPRFAIDFTPTDDVLLFASATRGFKSGGWNARSSAPGNVLPFGPEKVWSYEAGIKSDWFGHRLRANVTLYWEEVSDLQTPSALVAPGGAVTFLTRNFADYRNRGIEAQIEVAPVDGMLLYFNGGYTDDEYKIDRNAPAFDLYGTQSVAAQQAACQALLAAGNVGGGTGTTGVCAAGIVTAGGTIATPVRTPEWNFSVGGSYRVRAGAVEITPSVNANWQSEYEMQTSNLTIYSGSISGTNGTYPANPFGGDYIVGSYVAPHWLVNAGLTFSLPGSGLSLAATCTNCFDAEYGQSYLGYTYINAPRTWMLRLRKSF